MQNSPTVKELQALMEQVETLKAEQDVIKNKIKEAKFDPSECYEQLEFFTKSSLGFIYF